MQSNLPAAELRYTGKEAQKELEQLEQDIVERARISLKSGEYREVVSILLDLDNEVDLLKKEARRLRLEGRFDISIYNVLMTGYSEMKARLYELADRYKVMKEVRGLYNFKKYSINVAKQAQ